MRRADGDKGRRGLLLFFLLGNWTSWTGCSTNWRVRGTGSTPKPGSCWRTVGRLVTWIANDIIKALRKDFTKRCQTSSLRRDLSCNRGSRGATRFDQLTQLARIWFWSQGSLLMRTIAGYMHLPKKIVVQCTTYFPSSSGICYMWFNTENIFA